MTNLDSDFGTDPSTLNKGDLVDYARQLLQTILYWQSHAARARGQTRDQMFEDMRKCDGWPQEADTGAWYV